MHIQSTVDMYCTHTKYCGYVLYTYKVLWRFIHIKYCGDVLYTYKVLWICIVTQTEYPIFIA